MNGAGKVAGSISKAPSRFAIDSQCFPYNTTNCCIEMFRLVAQDEAIEEQTATHLPGDTVENLSSSNWKDRLAAMEKFTEVWLGASRHVYIVGEGQS